MAYAIYTADSCIPVTHAGYCASDMVIQTAAVVIDDKDRVLIIEDPVTGIMGLPRSYVPHCLDTLVKAPLAFLFETGYRVDPLPIQTPTRLQKDPKDLIGKEGLDLAFAEHASTTPFAIALDIAYFDVCNLPRLADGRQSIVLWYAGISRGPLPDITPLQRGVAQFLPIRDAVSLIQDQHLYDCVGVRALRLFQKVLKGTAIPRDPGPAVNRDGGDHRPDNNGTPCYPASMMLDAIFPPATPNTTGIISYAFWSAADFLARTGAVVLNQTRDQVLLAPGLQPGSPLALPRCTKNHVGELLSKPLGCVGTACSRLPLLYPSKTYRYIDGCPDPEAETVLGPETTTNPFFFSFRTWWDHKARTRQGSLGRQEITFWYAGLFDASRGLPQGCVALPVEEALVDLRSSDVYGWTALRLCLEILNAESAV